MSDIFQFIKNLPFIAAIKDPSFKFIAMNKHFSSTYFGEDNPDNYIGLSAKNMSHYTRELADKYEEGDKLALSGKKVHVLEMLKYADSKNKVLLGVKCPYYDETGKIIGVYIHFDELSDKLLQSINIALNNKIITDINEINIKNNKTKYFDLTSREEEVLYLICRGFSAKPMANILNISHRTVEKHIGNLKNKLRCNNTLGIIQKSIEYSLGNKIPEAFLNNSLVLNFSQDDDIL